MRTLTMATVIVASMLLAFQTRGGEGNGRRRVVLVELFTSEGCSSCPPAEQLLPELDRAVTDVEVIALAFHVDYWDHLGWRDRFSSPAYSARQRDYAKVLRSSVFTPQLIVDGVKSVVGSDRRSAIRLITEAAARPKGELAIAVQQHDEHDGPEVSLEISGEAPDNLDEGAEIFLAVAEDGLVSKVERGENAGRRLREAAVVRLMVPLGALAPNRRVQSSFGLRLKPEWNQRRLRYVAWIETRQTRAVIAAAQTQHPGR